MSASSATEWLSRKEAANYLGELGYPVSPTTLQKMAENFNAKGGPPFTKYGPRVVRYQKAELRAWLDSRTVRVA